MGSTITENVNRHVLIDTNRDDWDSNQRPFVLNEVQKTLELWLGLL